MAAKSKHIEEKKIFLERLIECDPHVRGIYCSIHNKIMQSLPCHVDYGYTDKPDFRISNKFVMIELIPMPKDGVRVSLRIDDDKPFSEDDEKNLGIKDVKQERPGRRWVFFDISDREKVSKAAEIIILAYQNRCEEPWTKAYRQ